MAEMGLQDKVPASRRRMTDGRHDLPRYPNLDSGLMVTRPDQFWVTDSTYVRLRDEFVYLAVVTDVFTRHIRGCELGSSLDQGLTLAALKGGLRGCRWPNPSNPVDRQWRRLDFRLYCKQELRRTTPPPSKRCEIGC
jgi:transposase InsO family protein